MLTFLLTAGRLDDPLRGNGACVDGAGWLWRAGFV